MKLGPPPSSGETIQQIIDWEHTRGSDDWTGPQGNADAWLIVRDVTSKVLPTVHATRLSLTTLYGRI